MLMPLVCRVVDQSTPLNTPSLGGSRTRTIPFPASLIVGEVPRVFLLLFIKRASIGRFEVLGRKTGKEDEKMTLTHRRCHATSTSCYVSFNRTMAGGYLWSTNRIHLPPSFHCPRFLVNRNPSLDPHFTHVAEYFFGPLDACL